MSISSAESWLFHAVATELSPGRTKPRERPPNSLSVLLANYRKVLCHLDRIDAASPDGTSTAECIRIKAARHRSRSALAFWAAHCLADASCAEAWPVLQRFSPALAKSLPLLRHLLLEDAVEHRALMAVWRHVESRQAVAGTSAPRALSFADDDDTFKFAGDCMTALTSASEMWQSCDIERARTQELIDNHWRTIVECQDKLKDARKAAAIARSNAEAAVKDKSDAHGRYAAKVLAAPKAPAFSEKAPSAPQSYHGVAPSPEQVDEFEKRREAFKLRHAAYCALKTSHVEQAKRHDDEVAQLLQAASAAEFAANELRGVADAADRHVIKIGGDIPPPIIASLPESIDDARSAFFIANLPLELGELVVLGAAALQALLPINAAGLPEPDVDRDALKSVCRISGVDDTRTWRHHFFVSASGRSYSPGDVDDGRAEICMLTNLETVGLKLKHLDNFSSCRDDVFFPKRGLRVRWRGMVSPGLCDAFLHKAHPFGPLQRQYFNPGNSQAHDFVAQRFDARSSRGSQYTPLAAPPSSPADATRSNAVIALPCGDIPATLTEFERRAYGDMRAHPRLQIEKVVLALQERSMPLGNDAVRDLLQRALMQIGPLFTPLNGTGVVVPEWKAAIFHGDALRAALEALSQLAVDASSRPAGDPALRAAIDAAVYFADWAFLVTSEHSHGGGFLGDVDRALVDLSANFSELCARLARLASEAGKTPDSSKAHAWFSIAARAYGGSRPLSEADAGHLCELILVFAPPVLNLMSFMLRGSARFSQGLTLFLLTK